MIRSPVVRVRNASLSLSSGSGVVRILRDVSLDLAAGTSTCLVGPSGSGKSTLLMVIAGLERPDRGDVEIKGQPFSKLDEDSLARFRGENIGVVFQEFHLIPTMTAEENVAVPLEISGVESPFEKARDELARMGLQDRLSHYPSQLSGGEQQRVAVARALVAQPVLLLADEPTGNLDDQTGDAVSRLIFHRHSTSGLTLFLVTHDRRLAARCDRTLHIQSGALLDGLAPEPRTDMA